jgi:ATP-dependent helicase HrpB
VPLEPLPIDPLLPAVAARVAAGNLVLVAPPGAGKTTRVPPALLAAGALGARGRLLMLEPRRVAARAAARRIAAEQGWRPGEEVGWQVRFERVAGPRTRLLVVTEGVLVRLLQGDPFLDGVAVVVFDEVHERSLETDLALAMARRVQREARPDLRLLAMSATLDPGPLASFLAAEVLVAEGRSYPVTIRYLPKADDRALPALVASAVRQALGETAGGVLAFLPGAGEIERTARLLAEGGALAQGSALDQASALTDVPLLPLHGSLPDREQDAALAAEPRRRIVLATNLAETSLTVPGVGAVVDGGMARLLRFDPGCGLDRLELVRISRAAAEQRAGRAGREGPGLCLRLWTAAEQATLAAREAPEVQRVDLAGAVLQLRAWGEPDAAAFPWLEPPPAEALSRADELLHRLGALDERGVTSLGGAMARLPLPPRLARLVVEGHRLGHLEGASRLAALLAERDPFRRDRQGVPPPPCVSDALARLELVERAADGGARGRMMAAASGYGELSAGAARRVLAAGEQVARLAARALGEPPSGASCEPSEALSRALLAAFPDRLARRRATGDPRGVMVGGRGVRLGAESGVTRPELFLCLDLDAGRRGERAEARVRIASAVELAWLPPEGLLREETLRYDADRDRVVATRRTMFADLALEESELPVGDQAATVETLVRAARERPAAAIPLDEEPLATLLARVRALREWMPELALPPLDHDQLAALLPALAAGRRSLAELRAAAWAESVRGLLTASQRAALEREAPERIAVPSGSRIALRYEPGRPPVLAARIQELFGLRETPRVAAGRVPVLLHLLAPNRRPQQVTDDLASFWRTGYPQVRKELRARYPRHAWPEDPLSAVPEVRPPRRRV